MTKQKSLPLRFWKYQWERIPLFLIAVVASVNVGVIFQFSSQAVFPRFAAAVAIIILYMVQIRASDEKKDFEHDNKFHKDRPVQRGLIKLPELAKINKLAILSQVVIYLSFTNLSILLVGLLSQSYAFVTRREFFIREWLRPHFHIYNLLHYIQLLIMQYAVILIVAPEGICTGRLIAYAVAHASLMEIGRKMYSKKDDTTDDSYSAQFGFKGSAIALTIGAIASILFSWYFLSRLDASFVSLILPATALALLVRRVTVYAKSPNRKNSKMVQGSAILMYTTSMLSVILGGIL